MSNMQITGPDVESYWFSGLTGQEKKEFLKVMAKRRKSLKKRVFLIQLDMELALILRRMKSFIGGIFSRSWYTRNLIAQASH
ncbi:hypothetical protein HanLR1_Chr06g0201671 [Helianthus annuus]|nr:hypothetical protein HanHA89_Chr06g0216611 [Helianthus annuus]KAJ0736966.1 hypothetical protein HanLR1_Chr06g0201671 [Helianthus annuus]